MLKYWCRYLGHILISLTFLDPFIDIVRDLSVGKPTHFFTRSLTFAATDTTSNALSRILSLLAVHPEAQEKLRQEILDAHEKNGGQDLSYDELLSLPFLDAVCRETLRL
jgi:Cytochrome P450